jgi:hypothetical protein
LSESRVLTQIKGIFPVISPDFCGFAVIRGNFPFIFLGDCLVWQKVGRSSVQRCFFFAGFGKIPNLLLKYKPDLRCIVDRKVEVFSIEGKIIEYSIVGEGIPILIMHGGQSACEFYLKC